MATRKPAKSGSRANKTDGERDVLAKIAAMPAAYRAIGERLHAIIKASAPVLSPKTWYGMPAYARDGKVVCFFRGTQTERYMTLGFSEDAKLDEGEMWANAFAIRRLTATGEATIAALVAKAVK